MPESRSGAAWSVDETLVAFRLYCRLPFGKLHQHNPQIIALARQLGRTPSSVGMNAAGARVVGAEGAGRPLHGRRRRDRLRRADRHLPGRRDRLARVFWAMVSITLASLVWQWISLPAMPPQAANPVSKLVGLLKRRNVAFGMLGTMLTFGGAFATFTYFRPFLAARTGATLPQLSFLLKCLGIAGFAGTTCATNLVGRHLPCCSASSTAVGRWPDAGRVRYDPLGDRGLLVHVAQPGRCRRARERWRNDGRLHPAGDHARRRLRRRLVDHLSITATFIGGAALLLAAVTVVGSGRRLRPDSDSRHLGAPVVPAGGSA